MAEDANTRYQRMLESTRSLRNPDLIKDFSQSNEDYVVDSANPNNLEEQFIPDNEGWGTALILSHKTRTY